MVTWEGSLDYWEAAQSHVCQSHSCLSLLSTHHHKNLNLILFEIVLSVRISTTSKGWSNIKCHKKSQDPSVRPLAALISLQCSLLSENLTQPTVIRNSIDIIASDGKNSSFFSTDEEEVIASAIVSGCGKVRRKMTVSMFAAPVLCLLFMGVSNGFHFSTPGRIFSPSRSSERARLSAVSVETTEGTTKKEYSFVNEDLRTYAMRFHTKDQAPREGQQKAEIPFTAWEPTRLNYVQFLVDSLLVYETLESLVLEIPALSPFTATGLERSAALKEDLKWMVNFDSSIVVPQCGPNGIKYSAFLKKVTRTLSSTLCCCWSNGFLDL